MELCFMFQLEFVFQMGGFIFKCVCVWGGGAAHEGHQFWWEGEGARKIVRWRVPPMSPLWETLKRIIS